MISFVGGSTSCFKLGLLLLLLLLLLSGGGAEGVSLIDIRDMFIFFLDVVLRIPLTPPVFLPVGGGGGGGSMSIMAAQSDSGRCGH